VQDGWRARATTGCIVGANAEDALPLGFLSDAGIDLRIVRAGDYKPRAWDIRATEWASACRHGEFLELGRDNGCYNIDSGARLEQRMDPSGRHRSSAYDEDAAPAELQEERESRHQRPTRRRPCRHRP
jgi:hypothetical protein